MKMKMMSIFVDTNIWVYIRLNQSEFHAEALTAIQELEDDGVALWTSHQVIREYVAVLAKRHPLTASISAREAASAARDMLARLNVAPDSTQVLDRLLEWIQERDPSYRRVHDANIVACMLCSGVTTILTNDPEDFRVYSDLIDVRPLRP